MANADFDALLTAVRQVLVDNKGGVRTVGANRFQGNVYESLEANAKSSRAMSKPRVEPRIAAVRRHPASPSPIGTVSLYEVDVEVFVVRQLDGFQKLSDAGRDDVAALAANDADVISQAMEWAGSSGNLTTTTGGTSTGLVSGVLRYQGSDSDGPQFESDGTAGRIETRHRFMGAVRVTTATS